MSEHSGAAFQKCINPDCAARFLAYGIAVVVE